MKLEFYNFFLFRLKMMASRYRSPYNSIGIMKVDKRKGRFHNSLGEIKVRKHKQLHIIKEVKSHPASRNETPIHEHKRQNSIDVFQHRRGSSL